MITMLLSPFEGPGGNQYIQIRLIEYLSLQGNKCKLFGTTQCFVYSEIIKRKLDFEFIEIDTKGARSDYSRYFTTKDYSKNLTGDDLLITTNGDFFDCVLLFSKSNARILFLDIIYPWFNGFIIGKRSIPIRPFAKNQELKILSLLNSAGALFFIDSMGKSIVEKRLNVKISGQQYLPIPIKVPDRMMNAPLNEVLNITYIGRCVSWKIKPVLKILTDVLTYHLAGKVLLNIVTDDVPAFKTMIGEKFNLDKFQLAFHQNLSESDLYHLFRKTHLNIGMGTAALDGAKYGIPTVVIDASDFDFPEEYRYRWIYESQDPGLGKMIGQGAVTFDGTKTFGEILSILQSDYLPTANRCYDYVSENYDIRNVVNKILAYGTNAQITVSAFRTLLVIKYFKLLRKCRIV